MLVSDVNKLRIAIALTVLRHKPIDKSIEAHILDLRNLITRRKNGPEDLHKLWRARAEELEKRLADVQEKHEVDRLELLSLRRPPISNENTDGQPVKKKRKKNPAPASTSVPTTNIHLDSVLRGCVSRSDLAEHSSLLSTFDVVSRLCPASATSKATPLSLVSPTASRAISTLSVYLRTALSSDTDNTLMATTSTIPPLQVLGISSALLRHLLATVLPILSAKVAKTPHSNSASSLALSSFVGALGNKVLSPLVCSLKTLTALHCSRLFTVMIGVEEARGSVQRGGDVRSAVLTLLRTTFAGMGELCSSAVPAVRVHFSRLAARLALDASRELETMGSVDELMMNSSGFTAEAFVGSTSKDTSDCERRSTELFWHRSAVLARKDAAWYICNALHVFLPFMAASFVEAGAQAHEDIRIRRGEPDSLLEQGLLTSLTGVLGRSPLTATSDRHADASKEGGGTGVRGLDGDEAAQGLILALVERVWETFAPIAN